MGLRYVGNIIRPGYNPLGSNITTGVNTAQYQGVFTLQQQSQAQSQQQWVTDPNFKNTTLLLQADNAANGAQNNTFLDSSSNNFSITRNGNTTQGTFTPFSQGWGGFFTSSGNTNFSSVYTTSASANFSLFGSVGTFECWVYPTARATGTNPYAGNSIGDFYVAATNRYGIYIDSGGFLGIYSDQVGGGAAGSSSTTTIPLNTWTHIAWTYTGSANIFFVNGVNITSTFSNPTVSGGFPRNLTPQVFIGCGNYQSGSFGFVDPFDGYISNVRLVKGTQVYTSNFTPPTAPLTPIANTQLLTCQSNRVVDNSSSANSLTVLGVASVQPFAPFVPQFQYTQSVIGGSGYFDGTGDYISVAANSAFTLGTNNHCIEFWIYLNGTQPNNAVPWAYSVTTQFAANNYYLNFAGNVRNLLLGNGAGGWGVNISIAATYYTLNAWSHIVITRSGTAFRVFVNGVLAGYATYAGSISAQAGVQTIGSDANDGSLGNISGFRFSNGSVPTSYQTSATAVGTSVFTPPTSVTTLTSGGAVSGDVKLLLNFTNAGIIDGTMENVLETVGNAQVSTSVVKYGSGSIFFDGTNDALVLPNRPVLQLGSADYTMEFWAYRLAATNMTWVFLNGNSSNFAGLRVDTDTSGNIFLLISTNGSAWAINTSGTAVLPINTWAHIAVVRFGTSIRMYVNGTSQISTTLSGAVTAGTSQQIGCNFGATQVVNGYIDDLRLTLGIARYLSNFTPPQVALPRQ